LKQFLSKKSQNLLKNKLQFVSLTISTSLHIAPHRCFYQFLTQFNPMNIINKIEQEQLKDEVTDFNVGDTVKVHTRVVEAGKERIQLFQGLCIGRKGSGVNAAFTIRKISYGEGVERVFPVHTPRIAKIEVVARGKVRRAKLNYLRDRVGKSALKVKAAN